MQHDLDQFEACLNQLKGVCYRVPMLELLENFNLMAKKHQVFIQQPHVCVLIFAKNSKKGCYTGVVQNISKNSLFVPEEFVAAHALPGPDSRIFCDIYARGRRSRPQTYIFQKDQPFSLIPGFNYNHWPIDTLPRPTGWTQDKIEPSILASVKLKVKYNEEAKQENKQQVAQQQPVTV